MARDKDKDPAFLFYSQSWLEGTAEMSSEEKGVYIDLLAHQHQKGSLPTETKKLAKLTGNSEEHFIKIWSEISTKFIPNGNGRLVNRKLNDIVTERQDLGKRNTIIGTLASIIKYSNISPEINFKIKKMFNVDDFFEIPYQNLTKEITEWYTKCYESIKDRDKDINKDKIRNNGERFLAADMIRVWMKHFPDYQEIADKDKIACRSMAEFIFKAEGITNGFGNRQYEDLVLATIEKVAIEVNKLSFWRKKGLFAISNNIQEFYNQIKNPSSNGTDKRHSSQAPDAKIVDERGFGDI